VPLILLGAEGRQIDHTNLGKRAKLYMHVHGEAEWAQNGKKGDAWLRHPWQNIFDYYQTLHKNR
jgi:hypothetical protein